MTSRMHIVKEGVCHLGLFYRWRDGEQLRRWEGKKERKDNFFFKNYVYTQYIFIFQMMLVLQNVNDVEKKSAPALQRRPAFVWLHQT